MAKDEPKKNDPPPPPPGKPVKRLPDGEPLHPPKGK